MIDIYKNDVHLWLIDDPAIQDAAIMTTLHSLLNSAEQQQQMRFYFAKDRHQYLITRGFLKIILSFYDDIVTPTEWRFRKTQKGKPYIENTTTAPLFFNLSHTLGKIIIAVSAQDKVGIDIEYLKRDTSIYELANKSFAEVEAAGLSQLADEQRAEQFFLLWTLKEAYIKAQGQGISLPMDDLIYHQHVIKLKHKDSSWQFCWFKPEDNYIVSLAANIDDIPHVKIFAINSPDNYVSVSYPINVIPLIT